MKAQLTEAFHILGTVFNWISTVWKSSARYCPSIYITVVIFIRQISWKLPRARSVYHFTLCGWQRRNEVVCSRTFRITTYSRSSYIFHQALLVICYELNVTPTHRTQQKNCVRLLARCLESSIRSYGFCLLYIQSISRVTTVYVLLGRKTCELMTQNQLSLHSNKFYGPRFCVLPDERFCYY